eukprot:5786299-Alexandrium_andersonii.AAC.1
MRSHGRSSSSALEVQAHRRMASHKLLLSGGQSCQGQGPDQQAHLLDPTRRSLPRCPPGLEADSGSLQASVQAEGQADGLCPCCGAGRRLARR